MHPRSSPRLRLERPGLDVSQIDERPPPSARTTLPYLCARLSIAPTPRAESRWASRAICSRTSLPRRATASGRHPWTTISARATSQTKSGPHVCLSGHTLCSQPASRPGDDIVIWSLLLGDDQIFFDPVEFWRSKINIWICTGFLISSAARCKEKGLSWVPASPYVAPKT
jgi:hypothetical protein